MWIYQKLLSFVNFKVLKKINNDKLMHAATVYEDTSGRTLDVYTTEPGL